MSDNFQDRLTDALRARAGQIDHTPAERANVLRQLIHPSMRKSEARPLLVAAAVIGLVGGIIVVGGAVHGRPAATQAPAAAPESSVPSVLCSTPAPVVVGLPLAAAAAKLSSAGLNIDPGFGGRPASSPNRASSTPTVSVPPQVLIEGSMVSDPSSPTVTAPGIPTPVDMTSVAPRRSTPGSAPGPGKPADVAGGDPAATAAASAQADQESLAYEAARAAESAAQAAAASARSASTPTPTATPTRAPGPAPAASAESNSCSTWGGSCPETPVATTTPGSSVDCSTTLGRPAPSATGTSAAAPWTTFATCPTEIAITSALGAYRSCVELHFDPPAATSMLETTSTEDGPGPSDAPPLTSFVAAPTTPTAPSTPPAPSSAAVTASAPTEAHPPAEQPLSAATTSTSAPGATGPTPDPSSHSTPPTTTTAMSISPTTPTSVSVAPDPPTPSTPSTASSEATACQDPGRPSIAVPTDPYPDSARLQLSSGGSGDLLCGSFVEAGMPAVSAAVTASGARIPGQISYLFDAAIPDKANGAGTGYFFVAGAADVGGGSLQWRFSGTVADSPQDWGPATLTPLNDTLSGFALEASPPPFSPEHVEVQIRALSATGQVVDVKSIELDNNTLS